MNELDVISLVYLITMGAVAGQAGFLILAPCYRTGVWGCLGLLVVVITTSSIIFDTMAGSTYTPVMQNLVGWIGMAVYLAQVIWRARFHALRTFEETANERAASAWTPRKKVIL